MDQNSKSEKATEVYEKLRQVIVPLWHSSRAGVLKLVTRKYGINPSHFHTLRRVKSGISSVSELAECLHVSKPNISRAVDKLVKTGYLSRDRSTEDRRKVALTLTAKADNLFKDIHNHQDQVFRNQIGVLSETEMDTLSMAIDILEKLILQRNKEE